MCASLPRNDILFREYPQAGCVMLPSGISVKTPFHAYDADAYIVSGTVAASAVAKLLNLTDLQPVKTQSGRAYAELWIADYRDTGLGSEADPAPGAYVEISLVLVVSEHDRVVRWVNDYSPLKAALQHGTARFAYQLILPGEKRLPIEYGREILSLDKRPGEVTVAAKYNGLRFQSADAQRRLIVRGEITTSMSILGWLRSLVGLLLALGPRGLFRMARSRVSDLGLVTMDVEMRRADLIYSRGHMKRSSFPTIRRWDKRDALPIGNESDLGQTMIALDFRPTVGVYVKKFLGVLESP